MSRARILSASGIIAAVAMLIKLALCVVGNFGGVKVLRGLGLRDSDIGSILTTGILLPIILLTIAFAILAIDKINRTTGLLVAVGYPVAFVVGWCSAWISFSCGCEQLTGIFGGVPVHAANLLLLLSLLRIKNMVPSPLWILTIIAMTYNLVVGIGSTGMSLYRQFAGASLTGLDEVCSRLESARAWPQTIGIAVVVGYFVVQVATSNAKEKNDEILSKM